MEHDWPPKIGWSVYWSLRLVSKESATKSLQHEFLGEIPQILLSHVLFTPMFLPFENGGARAVCHELAHHSAMTHCHGLLPVLAFCSSEESASSCMSSTLTIVVRWIFCERAQKQKTQILQHKNNAHSSIKNRRKRMGIEASGLLTALKSSIDFHWSVTVAALCDVFGRPFKAQTTVFRT